MLRMWCRSEITRKISTLISTWTWFDYAYINIAYFHHRCCDVSAFSIFSLSLSPAHCVPYIFFQCCEPGIAGPEPEPEPNFSKVGTGTTINHYGSTTLYFSPFHIVLRIQSEPRDCARIGSGSGSSSVVYGSGLSPFLDRKSSK